MCRRDVDAVLAQGAAGFNKITYACIMTAATMEYGVSIFHRLNMLGALICGNRHQHRVQPRTRKPTVSVRLSTLTNYSTAASILCVH